MKQILTAAGMTLVGAGLVAFNWWYAITHGTFYLAICLLGPTLLVFGIVTFFMPMEKLLQPPEEGPNAMMTTQKQKLNPLGWGIAIFGLALGGVQYAMLKYGLFL